MSFSELYFSFDGRIGRFTYWVKGVLAFIVISAVFALVDAIVDANGIISAVVSLLLIWPTLAVTVKRWHDRDKSGWWILIAFIPFIGGIWAIIETGFLAGTPGPNQYGDETF